MADQTNRQTTIYSSYKGKNEFSYEFLVGESVITLLLQTDRKKLFKDETLERCIEIFNGDVTIGCYMEKVAILRTLEKQELIMRDEFGHQRQCFLIHLEVKYTVIDIYHSRK